MTLTQRNRIESSIFILSGQIFSGAEYISDIAVFFVRSNSALILLMVRQVQLPSITPRGKCKVARKTQAKFSDCLKINEI